MPKKSKYKLEDLVRDYELQNRRIADAVLRAIIELLNQEYSSLAYYSARARLVNNRFLPLHVRNQIDSVLETLVNKISIEIKKGVVRSWALSEKKVSLIETEAFGGGSKPPVKPITITGDMESNYKRVRKEFGTGSEAALREFMKKELKLSSRIWKKSAKRFIKATLADGIKQGRSARELAKDLRNSTITNRKGAMKSTGPGIYKDPKKNAYRTARNAINDAYRSNDNRHYKSAWWIIGIKVATSLAHPKYDLCDEMEGVYPKDFIFKKWHVNCYDNQTEVYTKSGWKLFKDVNIGEPILSLNPETKNLEYVKCIATQKKEHKGEMVHFNNSFLDLLVTPDHPMFMLKHNSNEFITDRKASEMTKGIGSFYRSSEYRSDDIGSINIGVRSVPFDDFCQFMGYYLSDGSVVQGRTTWNIAAKKDNDEINREKIIGCLDRIGVKYTERDNGLHSHDHEFYEYLKQFGKSKVKHIPEVIMSSSPRQIGIFLDAFISCDGYKQMSKSFVGNRGGLFIPKQASRMMFTTSKRMAGQLGELLLKIGKRPSFSIIESKGKRQTFRNGEYVINENLIRIGECNSKTSTVYKKDIVSYDGLVYDISLEKNHTLYVRRNGKCVWGSNCLCFAVPIMASIADREAMSDFNLGLTDVKPQIKYITKIPKAAAKWVKTNRKRMEGWKTTPEWLGDNKKYF